jgi:acylphosphatase
MMQPSSHDIRRRIVVSGRVQGVGFRYSTLAAARRLGLAGWVRNSRDGSVEIIAEGRRDAVDELIAWCRHGPPGAHVDDVQCSDVAGDAPLPAFHISA